MSYVNIRNSMKNVGNQKVLIPIDVHFYFHSLTSVGTETVILSLLVTILLHVPQKKESNTRWTTPS